MEVMNMILLSIPNEIYNSVDACTSAKDMWKRVERLMRGTIQNKVDRETRFTNEFDQFVAEPGEALVSVYNRFAQLMNDLERNNMNFPSVTINTKVSVIVCKPEWIKLADLEKQRDKLELDVKDYKRQKEEYQKTQTIFNQTQRNKEEKYLDDILQLQAKIKDLENVVCKMGKSTETLRLLTNEQKAFWDNLHKSGLGYNGPYVLSQAYAKIPKLYRAYELCDKNKQLHVFDSEETLEDAEKSQLKMNEFQKDEKVQELKIQPIDYGKLNKLYDNFVPQKDLSAEQTYFSSSCISSVSKISSEEFSSKTKPSMASMPSANPMLVDLNEMENIFQMLFKLIQKSCKRDEKEMNPIVQKLYFYFILFQNRFKKDVKEMNDVFVSVENDLDETFKQNELLKDRLLEASLAEDIKNLVITSCVEIRNKDLHDEIDRISKESKDVSNENKTADTVCNDAFEVSQGLSKRICKKENEKFMASLQLENAHLKQTYKDLFESVQRSKVETNQCDEVKVKDNFDEIETKNIELEYRVASLIKENEHLKLTYKNLFDSIKKSRFSNILENIEFFKKSPGEKQHLFENKTSVFQIKIDELEKVLTQQTKDFNAVKLELSNRTAKFEAYFEKLEKMKVVLERQLARKVDDSKAEKDQFLKEINHLRTQLENLKGKSVKTKFDKHSILGKPPADKLLINSQISKSWFTPKVDMQKSLSKPVTPQSLPKNEKDQLLKRIAYLESKLASQDIRSCQKEYHELRTLYNALKVKFDSINRKRRETNVSKSSKPRESVSAKVYTSESPKPFSRRVSQFTTYSLQKDRNFSKNSQSFEILTPQKGFKKRASNAKHQSFEITYSCFTPIKQVWRPIKESQTFEASTSQKSFKTRTLKGKNQVFYPHSLFTLVNQVWRPKQSHLKTFKYSKSFWNLRDMEIQINDFCQDQVKPILNEMKVYLEFFQNLFQRDIKEMKDVFESTESELNELEKQNELLKDQLLEASLAEDIKNLVITSCVEIRNKDLHDEIDRISKESKDVSNESKTADTVCNDAFGVTQELSKRIVELEKDLSKFEAKSIAFEIALQHKSRENNSLKTVQKENENFMASLQLENAHLKQTYKDLFESVQRSKVETNQCDEVKVKDNFDEIETKNIELEYRVASLIKENEHLKLTYKNLFDSIKKSRVQTKTSNVTQNEAENLKSQLFEFAETKFSNILEKIEFFKKSPGEKQHLFENKTSVFQIKIDEPKKVLTQQTKDFNAVKLELSNGTAKFEAYFEKLDKMKVVLERQLARKVDDSKSEKD
ncbi:hypothetical protein Tco_1437189 [Tanacetum coccineum]